MDKTLEKLNEIMRQLDEQKAEVQRQISIVNKQANPYYLPCGNYSKYYNVSKKQSGELYETLKHKISESHRYQLVTLTFSPQIYKFLSEIEQMYALTFIIEKFNDVQYFACHEKHMNGVLHAHIMICMDPCELIGLLKRYKHRIAPGERLTPAVKVNMVTDSMKDKYRTLNYICEHKKDHPEYKNIFFNH